MYQSGFIMIEVFKTNVIERHDAKMLIDQICKTFADYHAGFDLEDCDKILRVRSTVSQVQPVLLVNLLKTSGFHAEILSDERGSVDQMPVFDQNYFLMLK